jgi:tetratricopeptide (TPR) repeat protein
MKPFAFCVALSFLLSLARPGVAHQSASPTLLQNAQALMKEGRISEALPLLLEADRAQPRNPGICQQIGIAYTQLQQFTEAAQFYRKALSLNPQLLPARKNLGVVLWFAGHRKEAESQFELVLSASPNEPVPHFYLGMLEHERGKYAKARDHFRKAGSLALENPEAFPAVLETGLATRDQTLTGALLSSAEKSGKSRPDVWFQAGTLLGRFGAYDRAIQAFERVRDIYPDRAKLFQNLGLAQLQARRYADAVGSFEVLAQHGSSSSETYLWLAEASDGAGDPQKAYDAYAKAIEKDPKSEQAYAALSNFAVAHYNTSFALKVLGQGLQSIPGSARLLLQRGVIQALDDKMSESEESFRQASQANSRWALPVLALGLSHLQTGKLAEAVRSFQAAADLAKDDYRPNYLLALAWVRGGGQNQPERRDEIISALQKAVKLNPTHADSHVLLGQTYVVDNQLDLALRELEKARKLQPENATALYQLAMAYRKKGQAVLAQDFMKQFEALKQREKQEDDLAKRELVQILKVNQER